MMEVISTRRYEAGPPSGGHHGILVDPENSVALVKEEEWETRKKKEITTTRQIETRVKRQVVLEDGEVVVDTGPCVTTNMTEDVEQEEHTTQERRTTGDQPQEVEWPISGRSTADGSVVQKELNETVIKSREEIEERLETEDRQQLGDISDEAYQKAIRNNRGDLKAALAESSRQVAPQTGPRVLQHTTKSNKVVDTEKTLERQELKADGLIVTEKRQTVEHEEIKDEEVPDDGKEDGEEASETRKEGSQSFVKKREEDVVDYVLGGEKIAREMRYVAETTEGERIGDFTPPPNMRTARLHKHFGFPGESTPIARKDALTKKPLDLEEEDEARKFETSKWLESHFGSESRSSHGSIEADDSPFPPSTNTSYINVTMKSCTPIERDCQNVETSRHQRVAPSRDSASPSGYFHGISEWSERKENGHAREQNQLEPNYSRTYDSIRRREHQEPLQDRQCTPSPPVRRKSKEQWSSKSMEKSISKEHHIARVSSPVQVVQRTWESRGRDVHEQSIDRNSRKRIPSRSRSVSPKEEVNVKEEKKPIQKEDNTPKGSKKGSSQSKSKIGESFRKLMGKLRSASTERKSKRNVSNNSTSQVTQTEDNGPTYRQYNVVDRCIPLVSEERVPERPPRSPRNSNVISHKSSKISNSSKVAQSSQQDQRWQRDGFNECAPPIHRYYLGEDPFGGSIYGKEKGYRDSKRSSRARGSPRDTEYRLLHGVREGVTHADSTAIALLRQPVEEVEVSSLHGRLFSAMSSSLGRFSKSTSRLVHELEREDLLRNAQTLPRNMRSTGRPPPSVRRQQQQQQTHNKIASRQVVSSGIAPSRQYGSMINISIKNNVNSSKTYAYQTLQPPAKPDRGIYKSALARSKSFNMEEDHNDGDPPPDLPFKSNLQLNRLDETPPLKSPGILASISRSNRDLFKESRRE